MAAHDFLVEIGTEELPPKSLPALAEAFAAGLVEGLAASALRHGAVTRFATPRRLAVLVRRLELAQPEQTLERRGPPVSAAFDPSGAPTRAASAFAQSCGTTVEALGRVSEPKGEFLHFRGVRAGASAASLLPGLVQASLDRLPIARRMRWGSGTAEFVRPVHWVVMLLGTEVLPASVLGLTAGRVSYGHRFMAPGAIALRRPGDYAARLEQRGRVIADFARRRELVRTGVTAAAAAAVGTAVMHDALLDEVTALVEWPVPLIASFDERYLALPEEVIIATLEGHQRYFPVRSPTGALMNRFVTVANLASHDPEQVRLGNERVVRPRLADAAFFWDSDRRTPLAARCAALGQMTFQARLGSYQAKSERVRALCVAISAAVGAEAGHCARAALLAKCDLLSGLVGEFPELQGTMGAYYARHDGEPAAVAEAIGEQYLPRFAGDRLPRSAAGIALALADRIDTLAGIFAIGQKPSGTRDPYGLRRAALGVLRMCLELNVELDLPALLAAATGAVCDSLAAGATGPAPPVAADVAREVYDYVLERLRAHYLESGSGVTGEMFEAVLERRPRSALDFDARLKALSAFLGLPEAGALTAANKRIANILRKSEAGVDTTFDAQALIAAEERALHAAVEALRADVEARIAARDYASALARLAGLRAPLDAFFEHVLVNAQDPRTRANRLALLARLRALFLSVADLSRLPG